MKKYIVGFLIGLFVCGIIGVSAANYLYQANEVSYTSKNKEWQVDNVESAINDLYEKTDVTKKVNDLETQLLEMNINNQLVTTHYEATYNINATDTHWSISANKAGYTPIMFSLSHSNSAAVNGDWEAYSLNNGNFSVNGYARTLNNGSLSKVFRVVVLWKKNN